MSARRTPMRLAVAIDRDLQCRNRQSLLPDSRPSQPLRKCWESQDGRCEWLQATPSAGIRCGAQPNLCLPPGVIRSHLRGVGRSVAADRGIQAFCDLPERILDYLAAGSHWRCASRQHQERLVWDPACFGLGNAQVIPKKLGDC